MPPAPFVVEITFSRGAPLLDRARLRALLAFAASREGRGGEVGLWVCTDDEIAQLHQQFMSMPGPTDVMSFPGDDGYLGDIAVSFQTAALQAEEIGHGTAREIGYLALHGLLHLLGYDDVMPEDRQAMIARQDALFAAFEAESPGSWA